MSLLTAPIAQEIARDTGEIIGFNVLITDPDGLVLGSADPGRVGSFHEASVEVMRTRQPAAHGPKEANRLSGVLPGVTLPVLFDDQPVGTVGITGAPSRVKPFGPLVRSQTEILLRESLLHRSALLPERTVEKVLRDIAHYDPEVVDPCFVAFRAREIGYDLTAPRIAIVVDLASSAADGPSHAALLRTIRGTFCSPQDMIGEANSSRYVILHHLAASSDDDADTAALARCGQLGAALAQRHGVTCRIGVGAVACSVPALHDSYRDGSDALYLTGRLGTAPPVVHVRDVLVQNLLNGLSRRCRNRFADTVTRELRDRPDWTALRQTVVTSFECGFNLVRAASALHIHRNTLVYRLHKIETIGGRSMTDPRSRLMIYLACLIDELDCDTGDGDT